jgi:hypothetical protein
MEKDNESTGESKPENSTDGSQENLKDKPNTYNSEVDQEIADRHGWTPQQAKEARLYL